MTKVLSSLFGGNTTKALAAILGAGAESMATGHFDWKTLVAGVATAFAVYQFPNAGKPPAA